MTKFFVIVLCLILCLAGTSAPTASAAARLSTSSKTALVSCLQQEYLMHNTYQNIFGTYPALTAFDTVAKNEVAMIATLKTLFATYKTPVPADAGVSAARTLANTAVSVLGADAVAITLEQSTATLMTRLLQTTDNRDVANVEALIKTTSLGAHSTAFVAEQTSVSAPAPVAQKIVSFTTAQTASTFLALLKDESIDVIEMEDGTYTWAKVAIDIDRANPVIVRPAHGATVTFDGANTQIEGSNQGQFEFGYHSAAGNIAIEHVTFSNYSLGQIGIVWMQNAHDIAINDVIVTNTTHADNGASGMSWAVYVSSSTSVHCSDITLDRWTVDGNTRAFSGLQVIGGSRITAIGWKISHAWFAIYTDDNYGSALTDLVLEDWVITDCSSNNGDAVYFIDTYGRYMNLKLISSGILQNTGAAGTVDGGGNSL